MYSILSSSCVFFVCTNCKYFYVLLVCTGYLLVVGTSCMY